MSLTLITDPSDYQFSKNPIVAEVETDSYVVSAGESNLIWLKPGTANGANAVGGTMSFIWATDSVVMTVATTPDDSGYQVRPKGVLSDAAYAAQLVVDFQKNYKLSENFIFSITGTADILVIAVNIGEAYSLYDNFETTNFGYELHTFYNDGDDTVYASNYKMQADLWMESAFGEADYTKKATQQLDPLNNICIFDFQTEINANLNYDLPTYGQTAKSSCPNVIKRFYLRYIEKYGTPVTPYEINTTTTGFALKAGVPTQEFVGNDNQMISKFYTPKRFLTNRPRTIKVTEVQQEFLYWLITDKINGHKLKTTVYFHDNRTPVVITGSAFGDNTYEVFCIPVGFTALNLSATEDFEKISKYTIQVVNGLTPTNTSEIFTFICDKDYYIDEKYILFSNSCGGADTLRAKGVSENLFDIEKETIQTTLLFNTPVVNGEFSEVSHLKPEKFKINTGWITKAEANWLEDLFVAEKKFIEINGQYIPFTITTNAFRKYDTRSTLFYYEFEYITAFANRVPTSLSFEEEGS